MGICSMRHVASASRHEIIGSVIETTAHSISKQRQLGKVLIPHGQHFAVQCLELTPPHFSAPFSGFQSHVSQLPNTSARIRHPRQNVIRKELFGLLSSNHACLALVQ